MKRWNGWGDETIDRPLADSALVFLEQRLGAGDRSPDLDFDEACARVGPSRLSADVMLDTSASARLCHAHGQSLPDWVAFRRDRLGPFPDAVARPESHADVRGLVDKARRLGAVIVPYGGGTSVVRHLAVVDDGRPVISVDMSHQNRLLDLDTHDRIATLGAGAAGPVLEAQLRAHGYTLGHYPQSFDYSTLGGWLVTRSAGQQSRRYGRIEDMLLGARVVAPGANLVIGGQVASAAGPDLRQILLGSEGRLGLVTEADMHVRPVPACEAFHVLFFADWTAAEAAARGIAQSGIDVSMVRLSNAEETDVQLRLVGHESAIAWLRRYIGWRGLGDRPCMMTLGVTADDRRTARRITGAALSIARQAGGISTGTRLGTVWAANRFAGAYARNALWDAGYAVDTMETAVCWSATAPTMNAMQRAAHDALAGFDERALVFSHLSHVYAAGSSVYMTVIWRRAADPEQDLAHWRALKAAVSRAIVDAGGTISHQHGVGRDHAPYLAVEKSDAGLAMIASVFDAIDPERMMNPHKLLPEAGDVG
ncbi:FAD-binding oxidoreductase [Salinisphaera hydrothermalis]|uniref:Alkylglycerone-phosphate synthase n=1 Tax=Salinisphaera hydrothermalis (strain C41B8) TaxID=1304275 RepID=A0A084ILK0_SALHC|nr:FAD-binding oxidoreductase [Salinisphaera hydrothermalis]KEZ77584.1 alkylglycerone-phosphate synthase [Salinisphaera hydrothermalis C41B8]